MRISNSPTDRLVLAVERRKSFSLGLHFVDSRNAPINLAGATLHLDVAAPTLRPYEIPVRVIEAVASIPVPATGYARFDLQASDLDLTAKTYEFAVTLVAASGYSAVVAKGDFEVVSNPAASMSNVYTSANPGTSLDVKMLDANQVKLVLGSVLPPNAGYITDADKAKLDLIQVTGDGITLDMDDVALRPEVVSRDDAVLAAAQEHADGIGDSTLTAAQTYADGIGDSTLTAAQTYADGIGDSMLTAAQTYADGIGDSTLTAAQGHANAAAAGALSVANTYTDSRVGSHQHSAADINSGTLPIARGGTGATSAAAARDALGAAYAGHIGNLSDLDDWDQYPSGYSVAYFSNPAGAPPGSAYGTVVTYKAVSSRTFQMAHANQSDAVYTRYYYNGSWGAWRRLAQEGQHGIPFAMAAGGINITFSNTAYSSASVTFPAGRFTATPIIVITQASLPAGAALLIPKFTGASPSGFTAYAYTGNATNTTVSNVQFHWIAVQMSATTGVG